MGPIVKSDSSATLTFKKNITNGGRFQTVNRKDPMPDRLLNTTNNNVTTYVYGHI